MRRASEGGVRAPLRLSIVALGLLGLLVVVVARFAGSADTAHEDMSQRSAPFRASTAADCGDVRPSLGCSQLEVDGRLYRYAMRRPLSHTTGSSTREAVLVDLGGPGQALFSSDDVLAFTAAWPGDETLLFVEEPWVTKPLSTRCAAALARFQRGLRTAEDDSNAAALVDVCGLTQPGRWGWSPGLYRRVIDRILETENARLVGVVGISYGAARTEALWSVDSLRWLIVNSGAPRALKAERYLADRADGSLAALAAACHRCAGMDGARRLVADVATALARRPIELPTRTPAVTAVDLEAAMIALPYLPPAERRRFASELHGQLSTIAPWIGRLSDATLLRFGAYEMSPAMLAYYDEVCRRYTSWPEPRASLLAAIHEPCGLLRRQPLAELAPPPTSCIAHERDDFVTSARSGEQWARVLDSEAFILEPGSSHGAPSLTARCTKALGLRR